MSFLLKNERSLQELNFGFEESPVIEMFHRIYSWLNGKKMPPIKLILTPTDRCNLSCFFCPNSVARANGRFRQEDELNDDEWLRIVDEGIKLGVKQWVVLGGGEPLLRRELINRIFREIKDRNRKAYCEIITNGTLFKKEDILHYIDKGITCVTFSIHGIDETYKSITGSSNAFKVTIKNIKLFRDMKERMNKTKPTIQVNMVVNKHNYDQISGMIDFFAKNGCSVIAFHTMRAYDEIRCKVNGLELTDEQSENLKRYLSQIAKISEKKGILLKTETLETSPSFSVPTVIKGLEKILPVRCYEPWYSMIINPDGMIGRCTAFVSRNEPINIRDSTLEDIWYGDFFTKIRDNIRNNIMMDGCANCGLLNSTNFIKDFFPLFFRYFKKEVTLSQFLDILMRI